MEFLSSQRDSINFSGLEKKTKTSRGEKKREEGRKKNYSGFFFFFAIPSFLVDLGVPCVVPGL